jgi:hypothetical protein
MDLIEQFDTEDDVVNEIPSIVEDVDHVVHDDLQEQKSLTYGISVSGTDLLFKHDNKTIKKVAVKSLKKLDLKNVDHFRDLLSEFKKNGADLAVKKFK